MTIAVEAPRRAAVVLVAVAIACVVLRGSLSSALVTRGDDLTYRGDSAHARTIYRRALALDPENVTAADRLAFGEFVSHRRALVEDAIAVATAVLRRVPNATSVRMDRAIAYQLLKRYDAASSDFARVGASDGDTRAYVFAGLDALHAGDRRRARRYLTAALRLDVGQTVARRALRTLGS
ncbi:MAG: hypothetical protein KGN02_09535 [bacterium]|nr:hypothetical protein [bacterium]